MNRTNTQKVGILGVALAVSLCGAVSGCRMKRGSFHDELAGMPSVTTPSVDVVLSSERESRVDVRPFQRTELHAVSTTVTHGPLFFETPGEDADAGDDTHFAWTGKDFLHLAYGPTRFLVNAALFPFSAVVTPYWQDMESDGVGSRRVCCTMHDAIAVEHDDTATVRP